MSFTVIENIVESLKSGDFIKLEKSILLLMDDNYAYLSELDSNKKNRNKIEKNYYRQLNLFLERGQLENFKKLIDYSYKLDIHIDIHKIPKRFEFISKFHLNGITSGQIGEIFEVIRFFNDTGLLEREFSKEDLELIEKVKRNK